MQVEYIDMGEAYTLRGYKVAFVGEFMCGDVSINDESLGEYERDEDGICYWVRDENSKKVRIGETEEDYERFVRLIVRRKEHNVL